jgi:tetratricopeptide (TPR) repeat protein
MKLNQYDRAVESLKRAIKFEPDDDTAWKLLGQAYYLWGQYDGAIEAYSALVEKMPEGKNNESEYYELAISYIKVGDTASAQRILSLLEEKNSSYAQELRKALQER